MLRAARSSGTEMGRRVAEVMDRGQLVTDEIVIGLIEEQLVNAPVGGIIFDGFPRTLAQADALGALLARLGQPLDAVVEMQVDDAALVARITGRYTCGGCGAVYHDVTRPTQVEGRCDVCGSDNMIRRADDTEDALKTRLMEYYKKTAPLIGYYHAKGLLRGVDGLGSMDDVASAIAKVLDKG
jgi:adenylate kinase